MRGVNDRNFINLWQILHRVTCPTLEESRWRVGDVEWRKDRHSFSGCDYALALEVHSLQHAAKAGLGWKLLVTIEHWWDSDRAVLRSTTWARVVAGSSKAVIAWLKQQQAIAARS